MSGKVTIASLTEKLRKRPKPSDFKTGDDSYDAQGYREKAEKYFRELEGDFARLQKQIQQIKRKYHYKTCQVCQDWIKKLLGGEAE